jgi:hypothetical protein
MTTLSLTGWLQLSRINKAYNAWLIMQQSSRYASCSCGLMSTTNPDNAIVTVRDCAGSLVSTVLDHVSVDHLSPQQVGGQRKDKHFPVSSPFLNSLPPWVISRTFGYACRSFMIAQAE